MKLYVDSNNYKCYVNNIQDNLIEIETDFFNGKCTEYIEGFIFIPKGHTLDNCVGETAFPWKSYDELDIIQRNYEQEQILEMRHALNILLGQEE